MIGAAMTSPSRPANNERPFKTISPLKALDSTPNSGAGDQRIEDHGDAPSGDRLGAEEAHGAVDGVDRNRLEVEVGERTTGREAVPGLRARTVVGERDRVRRTR